MLQDSQYGALDGSDPVNLGHPLLSRLCLWHHYGVHGLSNINGHFFWDLLRRPESAGRVVNGTSWIQGQGDVAYPGVLRLNAASGQHLQVPWPWIPGQNMNDVFTNPTAVTILFVYRHRDTTARNTVVFSVSDFGGPTFPNHMGCHIPWGDNNIYWDFGGDPGGLVNGNNRLTINGYTKDTSWHWWALVAGDGQGKRVYRDGKLLGSDSGTPTRSLANNVFFWIGQSANADNSDNADMSELLALNRGLTHGEILEWERQSRLGYPDLWNWHGYDDLLPLLSEQAGGGGAPFDPAEFPVTCAVVPPRAEPVPIPY